MDLQTKAHEQQAKKNPRKSRTAQERSSDTIKLGCEFAKYDHEKRIIVCTQRQSTHDDHSCSYKENRITFTNAIYSDPIDPSWVAFMRACRERYATRLFNNITASACSPHILNDNIKLIAVLPSVTHWEQRVVWNDLDKTVQTLRFAKKREVSNRFRTATVVSEKHLTFCCESPFIADFIVHFQTCTCLFMLYEYFPGGSLQELVAKVGKVSFKQSQFYSAQIVLALEYLHAMGVVLRDLHLKNVMICQDGYVKLIDLGNAVRQTESESLTKWFEEYTPGARKDPPRMGFRPPEVWLNLPYGPEVDWWLFGLLLYKLYSGKDTFPEEPVSQLYEEQMKRKIFDLHYDTPRWFTAADRKMFKELLIIDPLQRLGAEPSGVYGIKTHPWYKGISWVGIYGGFEKAPVIPVSDYKYEEKSPQETDLVFEDETKKIATPTKNPLPFGYQFQNF